MGVCFAKRTKSNIADAMQRGLSGKMLKLEVLIGLMVKVQVIKWSLIWRIVCSGGEDWVLLQQNLRKKKSKPFLSKTKLF